MKYLLLSLLSILCTLTGFSQNDYVITSGQDTIRGKITILMASQYAEEITIKGSAGKQELNTGQILSFVQNGDTYQIIPYNGKSRIMKLVKAGEYVSLYIFRGESQYEFGTEFLYKKNNVGKEMPSMGFKKTLTKFLNDCPAIAGVDEKLLKRDNLPQLVDYYNTCMAGTSKVTSQLTDSAKDNAMELLNSIKGKVIAQNNNNTELLTLINDISQKLIDKQKVPSYLIDALKSQTAGIDAVKGDVERLIKML